MFTQNSISQKKLSEVFNLIDQHKLALPELQRPSVWATRKIPRLLSSLYAGYPFGMFLIWTPNFTDDSEAIRCRPFGFQGDMDKDDTVLDSAEHYLIDGQQRITSFYQALHHSAYDEEYLSTYGVNIAFNVETEEFKLIDGRLKQKVEAKQEGWFRLKYLLEKAKTYDGMESILNDLNAQPDQRNQYYQKLKKLCDLLTPENIDIHIYAISNLSYFDVTEIFERINLGTPVKLSQILLGKLSAKYPGVVAQVENHIRELRSHSKYDRSFDLDTFMSMFTVISTGYPELDRLEDRFILHASATREKIAELVETTRLIFNRVADFCDRHYSIDRMRFFRSERSLIALGYAIYKHNLQHESTLDRQLAHWLYVAALGNQHNDMNRLKRDINTLRHAKAELIYSKLIGNLNNGHLNWLLNSNGIKFKSKPKEELGDHDVKHSPNSHLFGCVYGLIRSKTALSFKDGTVIDGQAKLEIHHIYPRSTIREMSGEINRWHSDIANLTFITSKDNNEISNSHMAYLNGISEDVKESHLIPKRQYGEAAPSNYKIFLTERRALIHTALTQMIKNLETKANSKT